MTFDEFIGLFQSALDTAIKNAERLLQRKLPQEMKIILHGAGHTGDVMDSLSAAKKLYLGEDRFYRIIDVSVIRLNPNAVTIFVRASSHTPGTFSETWNSPPGSGPFKQLIAKEIEIEGNNPAE